MIITLDPSVITDELLAEVEDVFDAWTVRLNTDPAYEVQMPVPSSTPRVYELEFLIHSVIHITTVSVWFAGTMISQVAATPDSWVGSGDHVRLTFEYCL